MKRIKSLLVFGLMCFLLTGLSHGRYIPNGLWKIYGIRGQTADIGYELHENTISDSLVNLNYSKYLYVYGYPYTGSNDVEGNILSYNKGDYFTNHSYYLMGDHYFYPRYSYNFLKVGAEGEGFRMYRWNELEKAYNSYHISNLGDIETINGENVQLTHIFFWHGTFVLMSDDYHTVQYIGNYKLVDKVVYVDTIDPNNNLWLIDFHNGKAWSMKYETTDNVYIDDYLFGIAPLGGGALQNMAWQKYYDVLTGGSLFRPQTEGNPRPCEINGYYDQDQFWCKEDYNLGLTFIYNRNYDYVGPDFGYSNESTPGGVSSNMQAWNDYQACERETSFKNFIVNAWGLCRADYSNGQQDYTGFRAVNDFITNANIWNENLTGELEEYFTGIELSYGCQALLNNSISLVKLYNIIGKDPEQYFDVMSELKYITHDNPYTIESICGNRPDVPTEYQPVSNNSNVCNLESRSNIINCFKFGSNTVDGTGDDQTYFELAISNIKDMIGGAFSGALLGPINTNFEEGKNLLNENGLSCSSDNVLLSIPYIDYLVYLIGILIMFLLFAIV